MSGLTRNFETSQGTVTLRRPTYDTMQKAAADALPLMDHPDAIAVYKSQEVRDILLAAVTDDTRQLLEDVFKSGDFIDPVNLWKGYSDWCGFREVFILPLEAAEEKARQKQAAELGSVYAAMIKSGAVDKDQIAELMRDSLGNGTSSTEPDSMKASEPTTAGTPDASAMKTSG